MHRLWRLAESDELGRNDASLVHELVEGVLAVGAGLSEDDLSGLEGEHNAIDVHSLAIALHVKLLDVRGKSHKCLRVCRGE